jgi:hypothetical protein
MKKFLTGLCMLVGIATNASAQFGLPSLGGSKPSGGADVGELVTKFNAQNALISSAVANSLEQIIAALGDKTLIATEKEKYEAIQKVTDPQEKAKQEGTLIKEAAGEAQKLLDSKDAQEKMKNLAPQMQQKVAKAIFNVGVAALQVPGMLDTGKKAIEAVGSNPMQISKVIPIKDGVALFADALPKMVQIGSSGVKLLQDVKVKAETPSASATLQPSSDSPFGG